MKKFFTISTLITSFLLLLDPGIKASTDSLSCTVYTYHKASVGCYVYVNYSGNAPSSATFYWNFDGGVVMSGSGPGPYYIKWDTAGLKMIRMHVSYNSESCSDSASIHILPQPNVYTVTGGGSYPSGGSGVHIYLSGSQLNYTYYLYLNGGNNSVATATGNGSQIDFGLFTAAGVYKCKGKVDSTSNNCLVNMADSATVTISGYVPGQAICVVSYDTTWHKNRVTYYKTAGQHLSHYNIYRETYQYNVYSKIGEVPYLSPNYYIDTTSEPSMMPYRYEITATDTLGNESLRSPYHKSIHLEVSPGVSGFNLIWNAYEGCTYLTCRIHRKIAEGPWVVIDSVPSDVISYTDPYYTSGLAYYFIEVVRYYPCQSFKSSMENIVSSNIGVSAPLGVEENSGLTVRVYPDPVHDKLKVFLPRIKGWCRLELYSSQGVLLLTKDLAATENEMDVSGLPGGMYYLRITDEKSQSIMKIIKD